MLSTNSPPLKLTTTPSSLTLTWPLASAGFTVQSRTNLVSGDWGNVASPEPQIIGNHWQVTFPLPDASESRYFRLVR